MIEQKMYLIRHAPTPEPLTFSGHADDEVSFFYLFIPSVSIFLHLSICDDLYLVLFQAVIVIIGEL